MSGSVSLKHPPVIDGTTLTRPCPSAASQRVADALGSIQVAGVALLLIFAALAFGAVETWAQFILNASAAGLLLLWASEQALRGRIRLEWNPLYLPLCIFAVLLLVQMTGPSAYPYVTGRSLLSGAAYGAFFFLSVQIFATRERVQQLCGALVSFGAVVALFALIQHMAGNGRIYWIVLPQEGGRIFGPYVNRNHYAGLVELLLPLALVWSLDRRVPGPKRALLAFSAFLMAASVLVSASRAGILALAVEAAFFVLIAVANRNGKLVLRITTFGVSAVVLSWWLSRGTLVDALSRIGELRPSITADTLRMIWQRPLLGWGAGTYEWIYPRFRSAWSPWVIDHAHNDYLELVAESGVVGGMIAIAFIAILYRLGLQTLRLRGNASSLRFAALTGCTGLLIHGFLDFNFHIPANAALFFVLAAVAVSRSATRTAESSSSSRWHGVV